MADTPEEVKKREEDRAKRLKSLEEAIRKLTETDDKLVKSQEKRLKEISKTKKQLEGFDDLGKQLQDSFLAPLKSLASSIPEPLRILGKMAIAKPATAFLRAREARLGGGAPAGSAAAGGGFSFGGAMSEAMGREISQKGVIGGTAAAAKAFIPTSWRSKLEERWGEGSGTGGVRGWIGRHMGGMEAGEPGGGRGGVMSKRFLALGTAFYKAGLTKKRGLWVRIVGEDASKANVKRILGADGKPISFGKDDEAGGGKGGRPILETLGIWHIIKNSPLGKWLMTAAAGVGIVSLASLVSKLGLGALAVVAAGVIITGLIRAFRLWIEGWSEGGLDGAISNLLAGKGPGGWVNALKQAVVGFGLGFVIGSVFGLPGSIAGAIVGAAIFGVLGFIGKDKIQGWIDKANVKLEELATRALTALGSWMERFILDPIRRVTETIMAAQAGPGSPLEQKEFFMSQNPQGHPARFLRSGSLMDQYGQGQKLPGNLPEGFVQQGSREEIAAPTAQRLNTDPVDAGGGGISITSATNRPTTQRVDKGVSRGDLTAKRGFVIHHTGGGHQTVDDVIGAMGGGTSKKSVHFIIDRNSKTWSWVPTNKKAAHVGSNLTDFAKRNRLSNSTTLGVEIAAKHDNDVTQGQIDAAVALSKHLGFATSQVFKHGELRIGKSSREGLSVIQALRGGLVPPRGLTEAEHENWKREHRRDLIKAVDIPVGIQPVQAGDTGIVGENGRELVYAPNGAMVIPWDQLKWYQKLMVMMGGTRPEHTPLPEPFDTAKDQLHSQKSRTNAGLRALEREMGNYAKGGIIGDVSKFKKTSHGFMAKDYAGSGLGGLLNAGKSMLTGQVADSISGGGSGISLGGGSGSLSMSGSADLGDGVSGSAGFSVTGGGSGASIGLMPSTSGSQLGPTPGWGQGGGSTTVIAPTDASVNAAPVTTNVIQNKRTDWAVSHEPAFLGPNF